MSLDNTLEEIYVLYNTNPVSPSIPRLQESILEKETSIAYLTDIIGIGFFIAYVKPPNTLDKKGKTPQTPSCLNIKVKFVHLLIKRLVLRGRNTI